MEKKAYSILLYYCYTTIKNPELFRETHHQLCLDLNLRGRIIVAKEGLNGTVSGLQTDCNAYMEKLKSNKRFSNIEFKVEAHHKHAFNKLNVRYKEEIVHSDLKGIDPAKKTGKYVEPFELNELMKEKDVVLVDMRSKYEHEMGKFKDAVTLDIENFRDLPERVHELEKYKEKRIVTYCTGGIKCEKASAYLLEQGFENVYQLHGGIIKYGIEQGGKDFEGKCYVFDNRIAVDVNKVNPKVISKCYVCNTLSDHMVNCANATCNRHVPICENCMEKMEGCCSETCKTSPNKRQWNIAGYYPTKMNGYNPYKDSKRLTKSF
ncbi:MAG: rhodanese-related sulfurtransferase [Bacteroidota bacterium]